MTNTSIELKKIRESKEFNQMDSRPFSNYALTVYENSLIKDLKKVRKKK